MDYKQIIEKLETHEELTKEEELAAQLALVHLPIPYRTRENVINHLRKVFKVPRELTPITKARLSIRKVLAALGSCPKCGYGFAGRGKADSRGKREILKPTDAKYEEAAPCPGCGFEQNPSTGDKSEEAVGFGEKYFIADRSTDYEYIGPFFSKDDAVITQIDLGKLNDQIGKWSGHHYPYESEVITENQMYHDSKQRASSRVDQGQQLGMDQEVLDVWGDSKPSISSPQEVKDSFKQIAEFLKKKHYEDRGDNSDAKTARMSPIKKAQLAVKYAKKIVAEKPKKVTEIADAIRRNDPDVDDEQAYRMAWETYCSYVKPSYEGCSSKGKSKRKSPKSEY